MVDEVVEKEGRVDVLVNNFGTGDPKHDFDVEHTDFEVFMGILRTNLASVYLSTQRAVSYTHLRMPAGREVDSTYPVLPDLTTKVGAAPAL